MDLYSGYHMYTDGFDNNIEADLNHLRIYEKRP